MTRQELVDRIRFDYYKYNMAGFQKDLLDVFGLSGHPKATIFYSLIVLYCGSDSSNLFSRLETADNLILLLR